MQPLEYLPIFGEEKIWTCYQNVFMKDIEFSLDKFPESNFRTFVKLKFKAFR